MNSSARQSRGQEGVTNDGISAKRGVVARAMGRFFGVGCLLLALITPAAEIPVPIEESRVLTNLAEIWMVPQASRSKAWRIRTEFVVYYSDPAWGCSWGEYNGAPCYLPLGRSGPQFRAGQRIALDGLVVPEQMAVLWEHSRYQVLEEGLLPAPLSTRGRLDDTRSFQGRWVELEGYVDTIPETDRGHLTLNVLAEEYSFTIYSPDEDATNPPDFQDAYVRLKGVYAVRRSSTKKATKVDLWVPDLRKAEVIGHLRDDERFTRPATPSSQFSEAPTNQLVRVEGIVRSSEPGKNVIIWDDTGQVEIRTLQTKRFSIGQRVEAIGYPDRENILWLLRDGLVRPMTSASTPTAKETSQGKPRKLYLAGQVRELSPEEASRNNPVELEGILLFYQPGIPFIFLQDASGGVCVYWNKPQNRAAPEPGTLVQVQGVTAKGDFCPVITNAVVEAKEYMDLPEARFITLEQALTGMEEAQWVEMSGCVREVTQKGRLCRLTIATAAGEFDATAPAASWMASIGGSIVRVRGVCTAVSNSRGQLKGVQIWVPRDSLLQLESEPRNLFELPLQALSKLRQFNALNSLNRRVRTSGIVLLHEPERYLYLQDGSDGVFVLSREKERLVPGEHIEVVGFPGNQQGKFLLREAIYRRVGIGKEPVTVPLSETTAVDEELEGRLVNAQGRVVEVVERENGVSLLLQRKTGVFEAVLEGTKPLAKLLEPGAKLRLAGVYEVHRDEYGHPRSFRLHLRSCNDLRLLEAAPWWTTGRLLWIIGAAFSVFLLALLWAMTVSRKNALLERVHAQLETANRTLESRVKERTRELHEEVVAKEAARRELADAQERLMLSSRRAGMAEIATSVLHNVGNVLNSVNISITLLRDIVRNSKSSNLAKLSALLRENQGHLDRFLENDPKGKQVLAYLETLGARLDKDNLKLGKELAGLARNLDHIKEIVSMQQTYARAGGVVEVLSPTEVVEDALRMQIASFQRHSIEVVRELEDLPAIMIDRHKVLQILNNLLQNAKWACETAASGKGQIVVRVVPEEMHSVRIEVTDSGVGIDPENLTRIFSLGFTTRKNGHGFGLHSAAIAAKEMDGSLTAHSEGLGKGATFVLKLPIQLPNNGSANGKSTVSPSEAARDTKEAFGADEHLLRK